MVGDLGANKDTSAPPPVPSANEGEKGAQHNQQQQQQQKEHQPEDEGMLGEHQLHIQREYILLTCLCLCLRFWVPYSSCTHCSYTFGFLVHDLLPHACAGVG